MNTTNPPLVHALRGGIVESLHRGAVAVLDSQGQVHTEIGDIDRPIFPRSAVKLLQALPLVESGAADKFGLSDEELALACASHGGETRHTEAAAAMLAKAGVDQTALECGSHWPYNDAALKALAAQGRQPSALHNNCSGKHAGFVCLGCLMAEGGDRRDFLRAYVTPQHPVMREVSASLQDASGFDLGLTATGTDGCSIPTHAIPLRNLAHAYAKVAAGQGMTPGRTQAARRLRLAIAKAPAMVAGTGRFDSVVMQRLGEAVCCKVGAEGVYCAALPSQGLGVALKMDDGNTSRACEVAMAALLEKLLPLNAGDAHFMRSLSDLRLTNWNGLEVGRLQAAPPLR